MIAIRTDSSTTIGSGHVMRCLTLASHLRAQGNAVRFVCRPYHGHAIGAVKAAGHDVIELPRAERSDVPHSEWQDPDWASDAAHTRAAIADRAGNVEWLIVDSYALAREWEDRMRQAARRVMVIDDLANRAHACDLLLDQNLHRGLFTRYAGLVPDDCQLLLGPRFALLRPEFTGLRPVERNGRLRRILVSFGASDPGNESLKALNAIGQLGRADIAVDVVAGTANPHAGTLRAACSALPQAVLHGHVENMAQMMTRADLAIGGAGATTWERCCAGLPTIVVTLAMNQESPARALEDAGCAVYLGRRSEVTAAAISSAIGGLLADPARLSAMGQRGAQLVDGRGVERVARAFDPAPITTRPAGPADVERIHRWRNAEDTRRYSTDPAPIPFPEHAQWFERTLRDAGKALLIGERAGEPVGVLRYDFAGDETTVSVYVVPGLHGRGYGPRLLRAGHDWLKRHRPGIGLVRAQVLEANRASILAFVEAGYERRGEVFVKRIG